MTWALVGEITVGPNDISVPVGGVTIGDGHDTLWVRATQVSPLEPWEYSYGLLYWLSPEGRELGTIKCHPRRDGEVLRLGVGLSPDQQLGDLVFDSRLWNRRWLSVANSPLVMRFEARTGQTVSSGGRTTVTFPATDLVSDLPWTLALPNALARLDFR